MKITQLMAWAFGCILVCNSPSAKANIYMDTISNKQKVLSFYKQIVGQRKAELIPEFVVENYKQHNPTVKQGRAGITEMINYLKTLPAPPEGAPSPIIRAIQEGDFVVTHLDIQFMGKRIAVIDLFKLKDGMLTEHWDAIQALPDESDKIITATNGTAKIDEVASSELSKQVVMNFYDAIIEKRGAANFIASDYVEHNSEILASGLASFLSTPDRNIKLHRFVAEGDFVMVQSQFSRLGKAFVFYEIYRIANNQIAEHWSVEQVVPDGAKVEDMF
jgi:predicted SnoaL-like aldol condensation-catalyzing enzyme